MGWGNSRIAGGKRTEVYPGGRGVDLRDKVDRDYVVLVPQGSTYQITKAGTYLVTTGQAGNTRFVLPAPGLKVDSVRIHNRTTGAVYVEPKGGTLEDLTTTYLMTSESCEFKPSSLSAWWIVDGE